MKILIGKEEIKITKHEYNRFWKPLGMFHNILEIKIDGKWCKCSTIFLKKDNKNIIRIIDPKTVNKNTSIVKERYKPEIYKEIEISKMKLNVIKYLLNEHEVNYLSFNIRKTISERRNTIYVFLIAFVLSSIYYSINELTNNSLMKYIAENNWVQTIIMFLTISSFINIFYPFTIKKPIDKKDIKTGIKETIEIEKRNDRIKKEMLF